MKVDNVDHLHNIHNIDNIERMEKVFDIQLSRMSKNQLVVLRSMLVRPEAIVTTREIARKTGVVEKQLGGVLSAMSRKRVGGMVLIEAMGRDRTGGLRWKLNSKAITTVLAIGKVRVLLAGYK